jgi:hypothetical protein
MVGNTNNSQQTSEEIGGSEGAVTLQGLATAFPNGKSTLQFDEFIEMIRESCSDE